jgi:4-amino-4-deoxy-L-arabinose transferase-like glycosyltransferase
VCGLAAVLMLFAHRSLLFDHGLRSNNMEAALVLCYSAGVYHFLAWSGSETRRRRAAHAAAVGVAFVLGFMTKFVAAVFLPMILAAATLIVPAYRSRVAQDLRLWSTAALLAAALIAPWFIYEQYMYGSLLWETMFETHVYTRFTSYLNPAHVEPWWFYFAMLYRLLKDYGELVPVVAGGLLLLVATIRRTWPEGTVVLLWFALPVAVISIGTSKLYHYFYPFLPAVALAGGYFAASLFRALDWLLELASEALAGVRSTIARGILVAIAAAALVVGFVTVLIGPIRLNLGWGAVRNRGLLRPFGVAVALGLAGHSRWILRTAAILLVVGFMPLAAYRDSLSRLTVNRHPIRTARDCLQRIKAPGVYEDAGTDLTHEHNYYLRQVGSWNRGHAPDAKLREYLFDPTQQRPMLLSESRYRAFKRTMPPDAEPLPMIGFPELVLLLPGPYRVCSP